MRSAADMGERYGPDGIPMMWGGGGSPNPSDNSYGSCTVESGTHKGPGETADDLVDQPPSPSPPGR